MHVNTLANCLFKIHVFAVDLFELLQTTQMRESSEILREAKIAGLQSCKCSAEAHDKQPCAMQEFF